MIYRYIGVLIEEASTMLVAYRLRNPKVKWPVIRTCNRKTAQAENEMGRCFLHFFVGKFLRVLCPVTPR